ncbi:MAG: YqeG family HAD IIIA-type phosphatase [Clostridia bacterium]|nr:YqeG family HAD IIIA-type phosphatase [Clostridia bacterium]
MLFEKKLFPTVMAESFRDVTPEFVKGMGGRALICDIDNTLVTYDDPVPTDEVARWFDSMREAGISVAFVSNNERERVELFNSSLGFPAYPKSGKPKTKWIKAAMEATGTDESAAILLGDQLLTDAAAANFAGIRSIIVPPIRDKKTLFFRFKRAIEKPYVKKFVRIHGIYKRG